MSAWAPETPRPAPPEVPVAAADPCKMYDTKEVAEMLSVSRAYVYTLMDRGYLPSVNMGKVRRVTAVQLAQFLRRLESGELTIPSHDDNE